MRIILAGTLLIFSFAVIGLVGCNGCGSDAAAATAIAQANERTQALITEQARLAEQQRQADQHRQREAQEEQQRYKAAIEKTWRVLDPLFRTQDVTLQAEIKGVQDIDISACPPDFRSAYVDFESSLENLQHVMATRADFDGDDNVNMVLGETIFSAMVNSNAAPLQDALRRDGQLKERVSDARHNVVQSVRALQKVSTMYGAE